MAFDKGHALVIGVGENKYDRRYDATVTFHDAKAVKEILIDEATCGYPQDQVIFLHNEKATTQGVVDALDNLIRRVKKEDTVFIYFAGHGAFGTDNNYYLATHDARFVPRDQIPADRDPNDLLIVPDFGLSQLTLVEKLKQIDAEKVMMIFNACHSGSLQPKSLGRGDEEAPVEGKSLPGGTASALLGTGTGRIVISACKPDQLSSYEEGERLTWFTKALKDGLRGESIPYKGYINAFNLYNYVYEEVTETAEKKNRAQDPMITVLQGVGPFPVALAGSSTVRGLGQAQDLRQDSVVNAVSEEDSKGWLQKIEEQNLVMGDYVEGDKIAGDKVLGDKIGSQVITGGGAFFGGPVTAGGDVVAGDQHKTVNTEHVEGDKISVGNISGSSGVAIGRGASAVVSSGTSPAPDVVAQRNLLVVLLGSDAFKINELQALSALVGFEWATLAGDDQPGKAVALVQTAEDAGKLEDLKDKIVLLRSEFKNVLG